MTSIFRIVAVAMVVGVLCVGAVALATDFTWDSPLASASWLTATNWDQDSGFPDDANDNAAINSGGGLCTYDPHSALTINDLVISGDSPTKRKLHVKNQELTVETLDLNDYGELDLDRTLTVNTGTTMSGTIWITATGVALKTGDLTIDGNTILNLTTTLNGIVEPGHITIDAEAADAARSFKLVGGDISFPPERGLFIISDDEADNRRAKFWLASGTVSFANQSAISITGGSSAARRAELDLDEDLALGVGLATGMTGHVKIDIAANKTFDTRILGLAGPCVLQVTTGSGGVLESS